MTAHADCLRMGNDYHVIARRAKPDVAISWYCVRNRTMLQEIATAFGLAMTAVEGSWFFCLAWLDDQRGRRRHCPPPYIAALDIQSKHGQTAECVLQYGAE